MSDNDRAIVAISKEKIGSELVELPDVPTLQNLEKTVLDTKLDVAAIQPRLDTTLTSLNSRKIDSGTVEGYLRPVQNLLDGMLQSARNRSDGAKSGLRRWWNSVKEAGIERWYAEAHAFMQAGNWSHALRTLDRILALDPQAYLAVYLKVICLAGALHFDEAEHLASLGVTYCPDPDLVPPFQRLAEQVGEMKIAFPAMAGVSAMLQRQSRLAIEYFAESLRLRPAQPEVLYYKAMCHGAEGEFDQARRCIDQATHFQPESGLQTALNNLRGELANRESLQQITDAMARGDYTAALRMLNSPAAKQAPAAQIAVLKCICLAGAERYDEAERVIEQIAQTNEVEAQPLRQAIMGRRLKTLLDAAIQQMNAEQWQQALAHLQQAEQVAVRGQLPLLMIYYYQSISQLRLGNLDAARTSLQSARGVADRSPQTQQKLTNLEQAIGNHQANARMNAVTQAMEAGRWSDARNRLDQLLRNEPGNATAYFLKAVCLTRLVEQEVVGGNPDRQTVINYIQQAKTELTNAERNCGSGDKQLRGAITSLRKQLP